MTRIAGVNLPKGKRIEIALTYVFGVGQPTSLKVLNSLNIDPNTKVETLTEAQEQQLREALGEFLLEGDLRRKVTGDIKRLQEIGSYRGVRHRRNLPVRGQRTKTNSRTKRGKRMTMGSGKLKITKK